MHKMNPRVSLGKPSFFISGGRQIFRLILYFVGLLLTIFGVVGAAVTATAADKIAQNQAGGIALLICLLGIIGSLFVFFRSYYPLPPLRFRQSLLGFSGATIALIMGMIIEVIVFSSLSNTDTTLPSAYMGILIALYGFSLIAIAHLKGKYTVGLLAVPLSPPLEETDLVESVPPSLLSFPRIQEIANDSLRQNIIGMLPYLTEEKVDIGLFLLGREFETTIRRYLELAVSKEKIIVNSDLHKMKLDVMIKCLETNKIITDAAALSYLRQKRNDRAHHTPTLEERQLLMRNIQLLATLYIDYIQFIDEAMSRL